jgi:type IV pilus assembly protein PilB
MRKLCAQCRKPMELTAEVREQLHLDDRDDFAAAALYEAAGCEACHKTGYKGRLGVYEVMALTPALREMILKGESTSAIKREAVRGGMLTLRMDGLLKLKSGVTSAEEVLKETAADTDL